MLNLATLKAKLVAGAVLVATLAFVGVGSCTYGYTKGNAEGKAVSSKVISDYQKKITNLNAKLLTAQSATNTKIVTEYVDKYIVREKIVYKNNEVIVNVVPETFNLSAGWVYSYNQSTSGQPIDPSVAKDATPSSVSDREGLVTIASNNSICLANTDQLIALQTWIKETERVHNETNTRSK